MKQLPKVGDQGYLRQFTGSYYVDLVKRPVTVVAVDGNKITVQDAKLIFPVFKYNETMSDYYKQFDGRRVAFFDTVAESIEPNPNGRTKVLNYHKKRDLFGTEGPDSSYPEYLILDEGYQHFPYLD